MTAVAAAMGAIALDQDRRAAARNAGPAAPWLRGQPQRWGAVRGHGRRGGAGRRADAVFDGCHLSFPRIRPRAPSARDVVDLTVPWLISIAAAISASDISR